MRLPDATSPPDQEIEMSASIRRVKRAVRRKAWAGLRAVVSLFPDSWQRRGEPYARYVDMLLLDHLMLRFAFPNRHRLSDEAWRAAQPLPHQVHDLARRGVRTIVNLRGASQSSSYKYEAAACRAAGITLVDFPVRSRAAPTRDEVLRARDLFASVEYPIAMHCKSGADRVGLMSALYMHTRQGVPVEEARRQLSLRYGHIRQADTGVLDDFFDSYLAYAAQNPIGFYAWVETVYDPAQLAAAHRSSRWANRVVDKIFRRE